MITEILLTLCMLGNIGAFCRLMISFKINFFETVLKSLDPDQARCIVGPDLDPNCLQTLSAEDTSRHRVNK